MPKPAKTTLPETSPAAERFNGMKSCSNRSDSGAGAGGIGELVLFAEVGAGSDVEILIVAVARNRLQVHAAETDREYRPRPFRAPAIRWRGRAFPAKPEYLMMPRYSSLLMLAAEQPLRQARSEGRFAGAFYLSSGDGILTSQHLSSGFRPAVFCAVF